MKKICVVAMAIILLFGSIGTISAKETHADTDADLVDALKIAYLDLDNASPEMQKKILDAREKIIFSTDWVADEYAMSIEDLDGNVIRTVPNFSEIFPEWDLPVYDMELEQADEAIEIQFEEEAAPKIFPTAFTEKSTYPQQCIRK